MKNLLSGEGPDLKPQQTAPFSSSTLLNQYTELPSFNKRCGGRDGKDTFIKGDIQGMNNWGFFSHEISTHERSGHESGNISHFLCTVGRQCLISAVHRYTMMDEMKSKPPLKEKQFTSGVSTLSQCLNPVSYYFTSTEGNNNLISPPCVEQSKQTNEASCLNGYTSITKGSCRSIKSSARESISIPTSTTTNNAIYKIQAEVQAFSCTSLLSATRVGVES